MISSLRGPLLEKDSERVVLEAGGVGYEVLVNRSTSARLPIEGAEAVLFISETTAMYGGGTTLYGFLSRADREMFLAFKEIPGTGAKKALDHLEKASRSPADFRRAVADGDSRTLTTLFGFTKKTAERLMAGLKDKLGPAPAGSGPSLPAGSPPDGTLSKALEALASLGYKPAECRSAIEEVQRSLAGREADAEEMVRMALRKL